MDVHVNALFLLSAAIINGNVDPSDNYTECMNDGLAFNISNEEYCFWLSPNAFSDVEFAKDFCRGGGGELAIIPDSTVSDFVANLIVSKGSPYTSYKFFVGYTVANYILRRNIDHEEQSWANWKYDIISAIKCVAVGLDLGELLFQKLCIPTRNSKSAVCSIENNILDSFTKDVILKAQFKGKNLITLEDIFTGVIPQTNTSHTTANESTSTTEPTNSTLLLTYFNTSEVLSTRTIHTVTNRKTESISDTTNIPASTSFQSTPTNLATLSSQEKSTTTNMFNVINESTASTTVSTPVSTSTGTASRQTTKLSGANTVTAPAVVTMHTSYAPSNVSSSKDSYCSCSCQYFTREENVSKALQKGMERIKKELTIDKSTLSSVKRRKISADDPRPSATYVGSLGIVILVLVFAGMVLLDSEEIRKILYKIALK